MNYANNEIMIHIRERYRDIFLRQWDLELYSQKLEQKVSEAETAICNHLKTQRDKAKSHMKQSEVRIRNTQLQQLSEHICQMLSPRIKASVVNLDEIAPVENADKFSLPKLMGLVNAEGVPLKQESDSDDLTQIFYSDRNLHKFDIPPRKSSYQFQPEWISNIAIFLPYSPEIMQILPFLLVCYMVNIPSNKLDYFSVDEIPEFWKISYDNSTRARKKLADYFCHVKEPIPFSLGTWLLGTDSVSEANNASYIVSNMRDSMRCWELIRRFAACVIACKDEKQVNFTLSYILFSKLFSVDKMAANEELMCDYKWEDIEKDFERDNILDAFVPDEGSGMFTSIDEIAYFTREAFYSILSDYKLQIPE